MSHLSNSSPVTPSGRRTRHGVGSTLRGLLVLNLVLLGVLAAVTFGARADAQSNRNRGSFTMAAGGINGSTGSNGVYIVDVANQELVAVIYSQQTKQLEGIGYRNLQADARTIAGGNPGR